MAHTVPTAPSLTVFGAIDLLGEEDADTVARATPTQRADLIRLMVGIARVY